MIQGYTDAASVIAGKKLNLYVSTDAPKFRVDFYRQGTQLDFVSSSPEEPGDFRAEGSAGDDWGWRPYTYTIPVNWRSAAYVAKLVEIRGQFPVAPATRDSGFGPGRVLFSVRPTNPGQDTTILYKLPTLTYHCYNAAGGELGYTPVGVMTLKRRGGGISGTSHFNWQDNNDTDGFESRPPSDSLRQRYSHWDMLFLCWLSERGYRVDVCNDIDLHRDPTLLQHYTLMLSSGHDEYWTDAMRNHAEAFLNRGGNIAFFGGNTCFRKIVFDSPDQFHAAGNWWPSNGENSFTGVGYRNAGGWWNPTPRRPSIGYTIQHSGHWVFANTGLKDGDVIGGAVGLVGYEADGAYFLEPAQGQPAMPDGSDGTPATFVILGRAELKPAVEWNPEQRETTSIGPRVATMGLYARASGGTVFNGATTDWPRVLHQQRDAAIDRITRNVIDRLRMRSVRMIGPKARGCEVSAIEGATVRFSLDFSTITGLTQPTYVWEVSWTPQNSPIDYTKHELVIDLPSPAQLVTVNVRVFEQGQLYAIGSLTLMPVTLGAALAAQLLCRIRNLYTIYRSPKVGIRDGGDPGRFFVDPLWDPVPHLFQPIDRSEARAVRLAALEIARLAGKLERSIVDSDAHLRGVGD